MANRCCCLEMTIDESPILIDIDIGENHAIEMGFNEAIEVRADPIVLQDKTVTPQDDAFTVEADDGYTALGIVTVNAIPSNYGKITWNGSFLTVS